MKLPVNNSFFVHESECGENFRRIKPCSVLFKLSSLLDVEHEVATVEVFHHKEHVRLK